MKDGIVGVVVEGHWDWIERVGKIRRRSGERTMDGVGWGKHPRLRVA